MGGMEKTSADREGDFFQSALHFYAKSSASGRDGGKNRYQNGSDSLMTHNKPVKTMGWTKQVSIYDMIARQWSWVGQICREKERERDREWSKPQYGRVCLFPRKKNRNQTKIERDSGKGRVPRSTLLSLVSTRETREREKEREKERRVEKGWELYWERERERFSWLGRSRGRRRSLVTDKGKSKWQALQQFITYK
jgi:hypothetical protein